MTEYLNYKGNRFPNTSLVLVNGELLTLQELKSWLEGNGIWQFPDETFRGKEAFVEMRNPVVGVFVGSIWGIYPGYCATWAPIFEIFPVGNFENKGLCVCPRGIHPRYRYSLVGKEARFLEFGIGNDYLWSLEEYIQALEQLEKKIVIFSEV